MAVTGTRPETHWDIIVTETLNTAETSDYLLHVGASFTDVPDTHPFYRFIETLLHSRITGGCTSSTYCPGNSLSRAQMAVFLARSMTGDDPGVPPRGTYGTCSYYCAPGGSSCFTDVAPSSFYCKYVHYLASQGVTAGCTPTMFCPDGTMTRAQMAIFLARILAGGDSGVPSSGSIGACSYTCGNGGNSCFSDVSPTAPFCKHVHFIVSQGISSGCSPSQFCPFDPITRGQMAVFLVRAFNLVLY